MHIIERIYIAEKPDAIWQALTSEAGVAALYFGSRLVSSLAPNAPYQYLGDDGKGNQVVHVEGTILACEPGRLLRMTHQAGPLWRKGDTVYQSRLCYQLEHQGFATCVTVTHDEFAAGDPGYESNKQGWMVFLSSLKSYLETGKTLPLA